MSDNWSWASIISSKHDNAKDEIIKVSPNLSTCPESDVCGQVDKSIPPLDRKPRQDSDILDSEAFEERAAIMEFDGGMTRAEAEAAALKDITKGAKPERF